MSHNITNFPSTTSVLRRFICPKFVFGAGGAHDPLPIPTPRRLLRLDLGVPNFISRKLATLSEHKNDPGIHLGESETVTQFKNNFDKYIRLEGLHKCTPVLILPSLVKCCEILIFQGMPMTNNGQRRVSSAKPVP